MRILSSLMFAFLTILSLPAFADTSPTLADCSIASLSGSSQALGTAYALGSKVYNRKYLYICNMSAVNGDTVGVNLAGGTAALQGAGTVTLNPGACLEYSGFSGSGLPLPPSNNINVIGTSGQPVLCYEGK